MIEYILLLLLVVCLVLQILLFLKEGNYVNLFDKIVNSNSNLQDKITSSNLNIGQEVQKLANRIDDKLTQINTKVEEKLQVGFDDNRKLFISIMESLTKIDAAQKNIESLSSEVISLQDILSGNKKARGIFGEVQLSHILHAVFGETNSDNKFYQLEYTLSNGKRCDAILFAPEPLGNIAIDAKFPLENYQRIQNYQLSDADRKEAEKAFITDIKKHIDKISSSYLIATETSEHAVMFIPAEGIFAYIHAYCNEVIMYASSKKVWVTAPSTMMATLSTIQIILKEAEQRKNFVEMQQYLRKLSDDFKRYDERWKKLIQNIDKVHSSAREIEISSNKISTQFQKITNSNFKVDQNNNNLDCEEL